MGWAINYISKIGATALVMSWCLAAGAGAGEREPIYGFSRDGSKRLLLICRSQRTFGGTWND